MKRTEIFTFFFMTAFSPILSQSPWAWECDPTAGTCSRVLRATSENPLELLECKMTCSDEGLLWPLPSGQFTLSKTLSLVQNAADFSIVQTVMDEENRALTQSFYEQVFVGYLQAMVVSPQDAYDSFSKQADSVRVDLYLTINQPYEELTFTTDETYQLQLTPSGPTALRVDITAPTFYGLRHGLETLSQLVTFSPSNLAFQIHSSASIVDGPSYPHRGVSVDTARSFLTVDVIKRVIDGLAHNKLNVLHWHISDSNSFPMVFPSVPQLAQYGAYSQSKTYSPTAVADLISYAKLRGIKIVPEIDVPRHSGNGWQFGELEGLGRLALCVNELDLNTCGGPMGGSCGHLNPVNPNLYNVFQSVYSDINTMFPSDLFHMGGDEVDFECWRKSQEVLDWLTSQGQTGTDDEMFALWVQFQQSVTERFDLVTGPGGLKKMVLWTSSLTDRGDTVGEISPDRYIIQIWTPTNHPSIPTIINQGYEVIMANEDLLYLDQGQANYWGLGVYNELKNWRDIYMYDPRRVYLEFAESEPGRVGQIKGAEACTWGETIGSETVESKIFPRAAALAERLWTDLGPDRSWIQADVRFTQHRERMIERGVRADAAQHEWCRQFEGMCARA